MRRFAVVLFVLVASSACLRSTTTILVRGDGSGTVVQETGMNAQALAMLQSMAGAAAEQGKAPPQLFGEDTARKAATDMGVRFVGGEPIKTAEMEGFRARFEFDDIRHVKMKMNQDPTLGDAVAAPREPPFEFGFERRGPSSVLTITMPEQQPGQGPLGPMSGMPGLPGSGGKDSPENQQALAMMKAMMHGLFVDISLDVEGPIVKTNAAHVNGSRITLLQLDFDRLLNDATAWQKLQSASDVKALANVPGLKVVTDRVLTIQFGR